jgi:tetratricopeptide (TPR) repeat protein
MTRPALPELTDHGSRRGGQVGGLHWPLLLALAAILTIGVGAAWDRLPGRASPSLDPGQMHAGFGPASYAAARARAESDLAGARETYAVAPGEWLRGEVLARALIARWRIAGDYADLAEADRLLDKGLAQVPDPAGPVLSRAMLSVLVHRLDQAEAALARAERSAAPDQAETADALALRGDIAVQRGQLDLAREQFAKAMQIDAAGGIGLRTAMLAAWRGDRAEAERTIEALISRPRQQPATLANLMLQRANLAYWGGEWGKAGRWVGAAQRIFPGYWLADAYAAQQFALAGRTAEAIRAYEIVARRTERPEVMDALAHLLRLQGQREASRAWAAKAAAGWEARARLFPEAVVHHRAEHELAVGSAAKALAFASTDAAARPQAPNLVLLARALLSAGRPREALAALDRADAQGWVSAAQQMARAETLAALGDGAGSAAARAKAEAINPRAADPRTRLIWFGHD